MPPTTVTLDDKYTALNGRVLLTGIQALVRMILEQRRLDTARGLEGLIRQAGVHAAGVIMSSEPLLDHIPVMTDKRGLVIWDKSNDVALSTTSIQFLDFRPLPSVPISPVLVQRFI